MTQRSREYFALDMRYAHALVMSDIWDKKISDLNLDFTKNVFENTSPSQLFIDDIFHIQKYNNQDLSFCQQGEPGTRGA